MIENNSKPTNKFIKIIKKTLITIFLIIFIPIMAILIYAGIDELITRNTDKARFADLDAEMSTIYNKLVVASDGVDDWRYEKKCNLNSEFMFWSGEFICETYIGMQQPVSTIDEISAMNSKYTNILKNNKNLIVTNSRGPALFPDTFETGGYDGLFDYKTHDITCDFNSTLLEKSMVDDIKTILSYGTSPYNTLPDGKNGLAYVSLRCDGRTIDDWYPAK